MKNVSPKNFARLLSYYPPYIGAGVKIERISDDWKEMDISMKLRWYNKNAVGTHFGGSLYSMVDPHYVLLLMRLLGKEYIVWDKAADIEFIKPGKGKVSAQLKVDEQTLETIKQAVIGGEKYLPKFQIEIKDEQNEVVARVEKTLYVRKKKKTII